ncbi:cytoplasmic protein [Bradyrhizobium sp. B124]|uniref:cytoplasmic protein n=1 Tax=Bradyrhizobium sp. B124 TaxID=3140245 RepID=UPI0031836216
MSTVFDLPEDHPLRVAHKKCVGHRPEIERSQRCGCFYCKQTFGPGQIVEWIDEDSTALCPQCGIDSVIGDGSGLTISQDFLEAMYAAWFD